MTEVVEIQAETPLLQTSSSELGTTVVEEQIKTLPLNGRNFVSLTRTVPGILRGTPGGNIDGAGSLAWRASASLLGERPAPARQQLHARRRRQQRDLAPDRRRSSRASTRSTSSSCRRAPTRPSSASRWAASSTSRSSRGRTSSTAASSSSCATTPSTPTTGSTTGPAAPKPDLSQHQFGATLGGPIIKDKTFFFADYQGLRITSGQTYLSTVPSMKMRQGDFSELNRVIYDPLTGQPFPGNIIPAEPLGPRLRRTSCSSSTPSRTPRARIGATGQPINNYLINPNLERQDNQFDVKVDHRLTTNNRFFVRYSYQKTHRFLPATLRARRRRAPPSAPATATSRRQSVDVQRHAHLLARTSSTSSASAGTRSSSS